MKERDERLRETASDIGRVSFSWCWDDDECSMLSGVRRGQTPPDFIHNKGKF